MAEIKSRDEEDLLDQFLVQDIYYWIGLDDLATEGRYVWAESHQVVEYSNWNAGEPNDTLNNEDCVLKYPGGEGWNDTICTSSSYHALCEIEI